jgi:hypothetical protein
MPATGNSISTATDLAITEMTAGALLNALRRAPAKALVFAIDGRTIRPGYHVTEVKFGRFSALDCGANPESWSETFIQLWDVDEPPHQHMPAGKFVAIIDKVAELAPFDPDTRLTFEFSDGVEAIRLLQAAAFSERSDHLLVTLGNRAASCKLRDRWLAEQKAASCCSTNVQPCCGSAA